MSRILHRNTWYDELGSDSLYEHELEKIFLQRAPTILPGFAAVPFKKTVYSDDSAAQADLALVQTDYMRWWVVEIERPSHSLTHHVLPQVQTLASGYYDRSHATYLANKSEGQEYPPLDRAKLTDMLLGEPPGVLVVLDSLRVDWQVALRQYGVELSVFQLFRARDNTDLIRLSGYWPTAAEQRRSRLIQHDTLRNVFMVESPGILPSTIDKIPITVDGKTTTWSRLETGDSVSLAPRASLSLPEARSYELIRTPYALELTYITSTETRRR